MRLCCSRSSHTCLRRSNAAGDTVIGIRNLTSVSIAHRPRFALPERTRNASLPTRPGVPPSLITAISRVSSRLSSTDNVKAMSGSQLLYDDGPLVWVGSFTAEMSLDLTKISGRLRDDGAEQRDGCHIGDSGDHNEWAVGAGGRRNRVYHKNRQGSSGRVSWQARVTPLRQSTLWR